LSKEIGRGKDIYEEQPHQAQKYGTITCIKRPVKERVHTSIKKVVIVEGSIKRLEEEKTGAQF